MDADHYGSSLPDIRKAWQLFESNAIYAREQSYNRYPGSVYAFAAELFANSEPHKDLAPAMLAIAIKAQERHLGRGRKTQFWLDSVTLK